jgi:hypothetical protein
MSTTILVFVVIVIIVVRVLFMNYILPRYFDMRKWMGFYLLTIVTVIFIFFPSCILLGNRICLDVDVSYNDIKIILLASSAIILSLCFWVWYKIIIDPKLNTSSGKPIAVIIVILSIIIGLYILTIITSPYWARFVGQ